MTADLPWEAHESVFKENLLGSLKNGQGALKQLRKFEKALTFELLTELHSIEGIVSRIGDLSLQDPVLSLRLLNLERRVSALFSQLVPFRSHIWRETSEWPSAANHLANVIRSHSTWAKGWRRTWEQRELTTKRWPSTFVPQYQVLTLASNLSKTEIEASSCSVLETIGTDTETDFDPDKVLDSGKARVVHRPMREHSGSAQVQRWGCAALHTLSRNELQCAAIVALGGVELLIDAMNFLRSDVEVYQFGFSALGNLASCIAVRSRIVELGGIDVIIRGMTRFSAVSQVQTGACAALRNLALDDPTSRLLGEFEAVSLVCQAMRTWPEDKELQRVACGALGNLATVADNRQRVVDMGGVFLTSAAMSAFREDVEIQRSGCYCVHNLAVNDDNRRRIAASGGLHLVSTAMQHHLTDCELQRQACGILRNFAETEELRQSVRDLGGVLLAYEAMTAHPDDNEVQVRGCGALRGLACFVDVPAAAQEEATEIESMRESLQKDPRNVEVHRQVCAILRSLSLDEENTETILSKGGIDLVITVMEENPEDADVQQSGCGALCNIARSETCRERIRNLGGSEIVRKAMTLHASNPVVTHIGYDALWNLALKSEYRPKTGMEVTTSTLDRQRRDG